MITPVQLMITCIIDTFYPEVGESVMRVLERNGVRVKFPQSQTCCGQPAFNAGMRANARTLAEHTIKTFETSGEPVVIPSGSCAAMIRHGYLELFAEDPHWLARAKKISEKTYEFTEFLVDILGVADLGSTYTGKVTYHASCHQLRDLGVKGQPQFLLKNIKGVELVDLPEREDCCGFGGIFSVEHPEISSAMLSRKISNIETTLVPVVVTCDAGCMTHINGGLQRCKKPLRVKHIAQILDSFD